jgi:hypothetical protein
MLWLELQRVLCVARVTLSPSPPLSKMRGVRNGVKQTVIQRPKAVKESCSRTYLTQRGASPIFQPKRRIEDDNLPIYKQT